MKLPRVTGEDWQYIVRLILTAFDRNLTVAENLAPNEVENVVDTKLNHTLTIDANFVGSKLHYNTLPGNFVDDAAAASGGVAVGDIYRNGSVLQIRVS